MDWLTFLSKLVWPIFLAVILFTFKKATKEFLETLKEWTEIKYKGVSMRRENRADQIEPPEETDIKALESPTGLSIEARMVLSTLWKHQQEYYTDHTKGRWSFTAGTSTSRFSDYLVGVGETMKRGLVAISAKNGQSVLTDAGILYCQEHPDQLLTDWNFGRWSSP